MRLLYNRGKGESEHLNRNIRMFESFGVDCESFRTIPRHLFLSKANMLYLNWYENIYNGFLPVAIGQYIVKCFVIDVAKIKGMRIYTSQHNRIQHDSKHQNLSRKMFTKIYESSDKIIVFNEGTTKNLEMYISKEKIKEKAYVIPPVNYIGVYPYVEHLWISNIKDNDTMIVLFIGSLNHPYKNVEMVIDIAKEIASEKIKFVFAGKVNDPEQATYFEKKIMGCSNIVGVFRFIKDDEMAHLLEIADIVIMPYDVESISNSGTARLAFSYGRTIICPLISSLESIPQDLVYTYTYTDKTNHRSKVKEMILNALSDYMINPDVLHDKGKMLKKIMEMNNSEEVVRGKYIELFINDESNL